MNTKLLASILSAIREKIPNHHDILKHLQGNSFIDLTPEDFRDGVQHLLKNKCIKVIDGKSKDYEITPGKEKCFEQYWRKLQEENAVTGADSDFRALQVKNLQLSNEVLRLQKIELKNKVLFTVFGAIIGYVIANLKDWL